MTAGRGLGRLAAILVAICTIGLGAAAETIPVRSGEHEGFTRLVIDAGDRPGWAFGRVGDGYELRLADPPVRYEISGVFRRIPRLRLTDLRAGGTPGTLVLSVSSDSYAVAAAGAGRIVIDIRTGPAPEGSPFEQELDVPASEVPEPATPLRHPLTPAVSGGWPGEAPGTLTYRPGQNLDATLPIYWRRAKGASAPVGTSDAPATLTEPQAPVAAETGSTGTPPPYSIPSADPTLDGRPGNSPGSDRTPAAESDPDTAAGEDELLRQLSRAAAQGLVTIDAEPAPPAPEEGDGGYGDPLTDAEPVTPGLATTVVPEGTAIRIQTAIDRDARSSADRPQLTDDGDLCIPDAKIDVAGWGANGPADAQLAAARSHLVGEFDRPDPAAVEALAKLHLYFGMGAEARQVLQAFDTEVPDAGILGDIASVIDDRSLPAESGLPLMSGCDTAAALWAFLSGPPAVPDVNTDAVLRAFSALPGQLRLHLGQQLAGRFLEIGERDAARAIMNAMARAAQPGERDVAAIGAEIALKEGGAEAAEKTLIDVSAGNDPLSRRALALAIQSRLDRGEPVGPDLIEAAAALAFEHRSDAEGATFAHLEILARAGSGDFSGAFDSYDRWRGGDPGAGRPLTVNGLFTALVAKADDGTFVEEVFDHRDLLEADDIKDTVRLDLVARLNDLGFAEEAAATLTGAAAATERGRVERARAAIGLFNPQDALSVLHGVEGSPADRARAEALSMLGRHGEAAAALERANDASGAAAEAWRAGVRGAAASYPPVSAAVEMLETSSQGQRPSPSAAASLEASRAAVADSAALRAALAMLVDGADAAEPLAGSN